jgi:hypothetical protein
MSGIYIMDLSLILVENKTGIDNLMDLDKH